MMISIIAAVSENNVIGRKNRMPWHMPTDMKYFMDTTMGHHIIMGRKNFDSIGRKPLKGRTNVVVTRDPAFRAEGCMVVHTLEKAIDTARSGGDSEAMIIGGGEIYRQAMPLAGRIYLTRINSAFEGDVHFPEIKPSDWKVVKSEKHYADERNPYDYTFLVYERN